MAKNLKQILSLGEWAIKSDYLEELASSGFGEDFFKPSGEISHENRYDVDENGIAVLHIDGALGYRSSLWSAWLGIDTYNSIEAAFDKLLADESVKGIVLSIHSPGGLIAGVDDVAEKIFAARGSKPAGIVAHSAGMLCSAAYWIAAACEKIYVSSQAEVGSIGTLARFDSSDNSGNIVTVRSNLSSQKSLDPKTPRGMIALEETLDAMATAFIEKVAKYRGITFDEVYEKYGQGKTFIGENAVKTGMVDGVKTLGDVVGNLTNNVKEAGMAELNNAGAQAAAPAETEISAAVSSAITEERNRILGIQQAFEGLAMDEDCQKFISEGKTVAEAESFCFKATKKKLQEVSAQAAAPAAAAAESEPSATASENSAAGLTAQQQALIQAGLEANAAAANGIVPGASATTDEQVKAFEEAFEKSFAQSF